MSEDNDAWEVVNQIPGLTDKEKQYLMVVARGEGFYGNGWKRPNPLTIKKSQEFGLTGFEGVGSNNWGAVQTIGPAGYFPHVDSHADGKWYVGKFAKYATPLEGAMHTAKILFKPNLRQAIADDKDLMFIVRTQHSNRYFELEPTKYYEAVIRNYQKLTQNLQWKPLLKEMVDSPPLSGLGFLGSALGTSGELTEEQIEKLAEEFTADEVPTV